MTELMSGPRERKPKTFFSPPHKVRANGTAQGLPPGSKTENITVRVNKPTLSTELGIELRDVSGAKVVVAKIAPTSLFVDTELRVGMEVLTVNGLLCSSAESGRSMLQLAEKQVKIVAKVGMNVLPLEVELPSTPKAKTKVTQKNQTPFRRFIAGCSDEYKPAVIKQGRYKFKKTPADKGKRRNDFKQSVRLIFDEVGAKMLPTKSPKSRKAIMKDEVIEYFGEVGGKKHPSITNFFFVDDIIQWAANFTFVCFTFSK